MLIKGMASGNLVEAHIIVKRYWFLDVVFGQVPTQSIITLLNGSSNTVMSLTGATEMFWFLRFLLLSVHLDNVIMNTPFELFNQNDLPKLFKVCTYFPRVTPSKYTSFSWANSI